MDGAQNAGRVTANAILFKLSGAVTQPVADPTPVPTVSEARQKLREYEDLHPLPALPAAPLKPGSRSPLPSLARFGRGSAHAALHLAGDAIRTLNPGIFEGGSKPWRPLLDRMRPDKAIRGVVDGLLGVIP